MQNIYSRIVKIVSSRKFFWFIVVLFVLQALWVAFSFRYPMVYDEAFHFPIIQIFSHQLSPIITHQAPQYDYLRDLTHEGSKLFHYIMSFPFRFIELFTQTQQVQIVFLRVLNILMVASGLVLFGRLFRKIGIKQLHTNIALLFFTLIPTFILVSATINYDNMLFPLTAWYFLLCVALLNAKKVNWLNYAMIVIVGCAASLVKFTFLPIFAASIIYLTVVVIKRFGKKLLPQFVKSFKQTNIYKQIGISTLLVIFIGLFSFVYIKNTIEYHKPDPSCLQTMKVSRCKANSIVVRGVQAQATKDQRPAQKLGEFTVGWYERMVNFDLTGNNTTTGTAEFALSTSTLQNMYIFGTIIGLGVLLYAWRSLSKNAGWYFLLTMSAVLVLAVYYVNVTGYYKSHAAFANQPRYLLSVMPIVMVMSVVAFSFALRKYKYLKLASLFVVLLLFTQGGGVTTNIIRSNDTWYWQKPAIIKANHAAKKVLDPLIRG